MSRLASACVVLIVAVSLDASPPPMAASLTQARPQRPARDTSERRTGTAQIGGRVVAADTGAPLRQVTVRLSSSVLEGERIARTNALGQYSFPELPAGTYLLQASKPGFAQLRYEAADPLEPGRPVQIRDGDAITNANFSLPRAAVISGRVVDELGDPVLDAEVRALRHQMLSGQRRLTVASRARQTDDLGAFRLFGLLPGTYYISAVPRRADQPTEEEQPSGYAPTYYPGTADLTRAQPITVRLGEEASNITLALAGARVVRISGTVSDSDGEPGSGARVTVVRRDGAHGFVTVAETRVRRDGAFELPNLAPGSYALQAWITFATSEREPEFGAVPLELVETDLASVVVRTTKGATLQGRFVLRSDAARKPFKPFLVEVSAHPASQDIRFPVGGGSTVRVKDDWTFELRGLSGPRLIRVSGIPSPWGLEAVLFGGADITDTPVEVRPGSKTRGLEVVLTDRTTDVVGTVALPDSARASRVSVIAFAADSSRWGPLSRHVQVRRPDMEGRFSVRGLPPGPYLAVAVPYVWQGEWSDPDFLERARLVATRFTLGPAQRTTIQLKLVSVP